MKKIEKNQKKYTLSDILKSEVVLVNESETIKIPKYKMPLEFGIGMKIVIDRNGCYQKA